MFNSAIRYELLEELARLALKCRHMVTGSSPDAVRFQEVVEALSIGSETEPADDLSGLLEAIGGRPDRSKGSLYWQAAALIPV